MVERTDLIKRSSCSLRHSRMSSARGTKLIASYFDHIARDTGKYCFGIKDTMTALEMSAVEKLIVWENLDLERLELRNTTTNETSIKYLKPEQLKDASNFHDEKTERNLPLRIVRSLWNGLLRITKRLVARSSSYGQIPGGISVRKGFGVGGVSFSMG